MHVLRYLLPLLALFALTAACGDDGEDVPSDGSPSPSGTSAEVPQLTRQYMQLGEARQLLAGLGLEGVSLAPDRYECIQDECPDEAPGDDSWGCLSILPTGDPDNETAESLLPDDPPGWYSVGWGGTFRETYAARPEPVVNEPRVELEQGQDMACGADFERYMTAAEASQFLQVTGLDGRWQNPHSDAPDPTCAPGDDCPVPGIPSDTEGCLDVAIPELPHNGPGQVDASVDVYISWFSEGNAENPDGIQFLYSLRRLLKDVEAAVAPRTDEECLTLRGGRPNNPIDLYESVPYTEIIQPTYWYVTEAPNGTTLMLDVAAGGSCEVFERLDVEETDNSVTINAFIRHSTEGPNRLCDLSLDHHFATVELEEPLGDRPLLGCAPAEIWYVDHNIDCAEPRSG